MGHVQGYALFGGDCNDGNGGSAINPAATEVCDGQDNDCDEQIDEGVDPIDYYYDYDGDGSGSINQKVTTCTPSTGYVTNSLDCIDSDDSINPGATEVCDGQDNNCDGRVDEDLLTTYYADGDGDGY